MRQRRTLVISVVFVTVLAGLSIAARRLETVAQSGGTVQAPRFEVDPFWPKPLPNNWLLGSAIGVSVDSRDHVWIVHRGAATLNARFSSEVRYPRGSTIRIEVPPAAAHR